MVATAAWTAEQIDQAQPRLSLTSISRHAGDWYPEGNSNTDVAYPGCTVGQGFSAIGNGVKITFTRSGCQGGITAPRILAIGDSHAVGHAELFKKYTLATGASVLLYNNGGCPFLSLQPWREDDAACRSNAAAALDDMLANVQAGDVVFLPSLRLPRFADQWIRFPDSQMKDAIFSDWAVKGREMATKAAVDVLQKFTAKGAHVVIEAPTPVFKSPTFRCAERYNRTNPICRDGTTVGRDEMEELRKPSLDALTRLAHTVSNVSVWDPFPILCPVAPTCNAFLDGRPLFFDGDHVSGFGNRLLLPSFLAFVSHESAVSK
jgi:hypothetical protein